MQDVSSPSAHVRSTEPTIDAARRRSGRAGVGLARRTTRTVAVTAAALAGLGFVTLPAAQAKPVAPVKPRAATVTAQRAYAPRATTMSAPVRSVPVRTMNAATTGTTYYVATRGADTNVGTSSGAAFATIGRALRSARAGDTVSIGAGNYGPFRIETAGVSVVGSPGATIVGTAAARDNVLIAASNVTVRNLDLMGCKPNPAPASGGIDTGMSTGIRVAARTSGATISGLTIRDSWGTNLQGLPFACVGVLLDNTTGNTVSNSEIRHNGYGIYVMGGGGGTTLSGNTVHDNDRIIKNTTLAGDDWGGVGIGFSNATDVTATGNTVYNNGGPSHDWTVDGGGFEIWQSSRIKITSNTIYNNVNILETGAGASNNCVDNAFTGNTASGRTTRTNLVRSVGLILRCGKNMSVLNNTISHLDWWSMWIYQRQADGRNGGSIDGLKVQQNTITQGYDTVFSIGLLPTNPGVTINNNKYSYLGAFGTNPSGQRIGFGAWQSTTGFDHTPLA